jgi:hypothetical protein
MKTINNNVKNTNSTFNGIEILNSFEMLNIRGGNTNNGKLKTREIDIYDTRED